MHFHILVLSVLIHYPLRTSPIPFITVGTAWLELRWAGLAWHTATGRAWAKRTTLPDGDGPARVRPGLARHRLSEAWLTQHASGPARHAEAWLAWPPSCWLMGPAWLGMGGTGEHAGARPGQWVEWATSSRFNQLVLNFLAIL